jgi:mono/diheme cytochrome c family protein
VTARRLLVLPLLAVLVAGCGGHDRGRAIFERDCTSCHTLSGPAGGLTGFGNLRGRHLDAATVASFVRIMPVQPPLSDVDVRAVSAYVAQRSG